MALFGNKKTDAAPEKTVAPVVAKKGTGVPRSLSDILKHPRITEKASMHQGTSVYTFDVAPSATKRDIKAAVRAIYKVNPTKVAVVTIPSKLRRSMKTGKRGVKKGGRKAYVFLKKGETISIA